MRPYHACIMGGLLNFRIHTARDNSVYNIVCLCASLSAKVWIQFTHYYSIQHGACSRASPLSYLWSSPQTPPTHHVEKVSGVYILVRSQNGDIQNQIAEQPINVTCIRSPRALVVGGASHASRYCTVHRIVRI